MRSVKLFTPYDLVIFLTLLSGSLWGAFKMPSALPRHPVAIVEIGGKPAYRIPLDRKHLVLLTEWDPPVKLQVEPGKIRVLENDCSKQICVHTGYISQLNQTIACVPKKLLIYLREGHDRKKSKQIEAITR